MGSHTVPARKRRHPDARDQPPPPYGARLCHRRPRPRSALLAAALTLVLAGQAPGAFAFAHPSGAGPAGAVKLTNGTLLVAREAQVALPSGFSVTVPQLVSPGVTMSPSPAYAGSQGVKVGYWVNMTGTTVLASSWPRCGCSLTRPPRTGAT